MNVVRPIEEILKAVGDMFGDDPSEEQLSLLEDVADTLADAASDWKAKYEENDRDWRRRYRDRFTTPGEVKVEVEVEESPDDDEFAEKRRNYEDLFKEEK